MVPQWGKVEGGGSFRGKEGSGPQRIEREKRLFQNLTWSRRQGKKKRTCEKKGEGRGGRKGASRPAPNSAISVRFAHSRKKRGRGGGKGKATKKGKKRIARTNPALYLPKSTTHQYRSSEE